MVTNLSTANGAGIPAAGGSAATPHNPADSAQEAKLRKAAGDFESILLASMWKGMKQSFASPDDDQSDPAQGTLSDWGIEVMSGAVGKAGGLGIGNMILKHLEPLIHDSASAPAAEGSGPATGEIDNSK